MYRFLEIISQFLKTLYIYYMLKTVIGAYPKLEFSKLTYWFNTYKTDKKYQQNTTRMK